MVAGEPLPPLQTVVDLPPVRHRAIERATAAGDRRGRACRPRRRLGRRKALAVTFCRWETRTTQPETLPNFLRTNIKHANYGRNAAFENGLSSSAAIVWSYPNPIDQNPWAHWRSPMDMMRQG